MKFGMKEKEEEILRRRRRLMIVAGEAGAGTEMEKSVLAMVGRGTAIGQHPDGRHLIAIVVIHQGGTRRERTIEGMDEEEGVEMVHILRILLHLQSLIRSLQIF